MRVIIILAFVSLIGCESELISKEDAGEIINITSVPTSFNESIKTGVETTNGTFIVRGTISAMKGSAVTVDTYKEWDGSTRSYLCISGRNRCPWILGF